MKTIVYTLIGIIILVIGTSSSCRKEKSDGLVTINNANYTINVRILFNYPDTTLEMGENCLDCTADIEPNTLKEHFFFPNSRYNWSTIIADRNSHSTLTMFVIHRDTLDKYSFEQIQQDYNILKRYDLSVEDLENQNWTITYP